MFVTLGAYWSDKCGKEIEPEEPDEGVYAGIDRQVVGCLPGSTDQWIMPAGGSCSASGVASNSKTSGGPGGCAIPNTGGMNGVNVADCWVLPGATTAVEMTLAVTNATQNQGYYTDYNMTSFAKSDCSGIAQSYWGPVHSSNALVNGDYVYQTSCYDSPSGTTWQSYYVWNIAAYEKLYSAGGGP